MLRKIKYLVAGLSLLLIPILMNGNVLADAKSAVCEGIGLATASGGCEQDTTSPTVNSTIKAVVTILTFLVGAISVIMVIVGGFRYVTSGGDSTKVGSAKNTIIYAVIGLIITALAQIIIQFTINKTSNVTTPTPTVTPSICETDPSRCNP